MREKDKEKEQAQNITVIFILWKLTLLCGKVNQIIFASQLFPSISECLRGLINIKFTV